MTLCICGRESAKPSYPNYIINHQKVTGDRSQRATNNIKQKRDCLLSYIWYFVTIKNTSVLIWVHSLWLPLEWMRWWGEVTYEHLSWWGFSLVAGHLQRCWNVEALSLVHPACHNHHSSHWADTRREIEWVPHLIVSKPARCLAAGEASTFDDNWNAKSTNDDKQPYQRFVCVCGWINLV